MIKSEPLSTAARPPAPPPEVSGRIPVLGHMLNFYRDQEGLFRRGYGEHGNVFTIQLMGQKVAVVVGPEEQAFFFKETDKTLDMEKSYGFLAAMFGKIAFLGTHETYLNHRPVLHSLFGRDLMVEYLAVMSRVVNKWLERLGHEGEIEITHELVELVKEVAGRSFLGDAVHERLEASGFWKQYDILGASLDPLLYKLPLPKFIRRDIAKRRIRQILQPLIDERRANPVDDGFQRLLDQPDGKGEQLPDDIVAAFFSALMFAGHETTAGQAAWSVIQVAQHPTVMQQLRAEVEAALGDSDEVDHVALRNMPLVDAAVKETGRMRPSAETLIRTAEEDIELDGYTIPAGWLVMTSTAAAHFIPEYFSDPYRYDPLRYLERKEGRGHQLITFGGGLHTCTGKNFASAEMAIITALFFRDYDAELVTPYEDIGVVRTSSSRPGKAIIRYKRRQ
jgi:sterol 14-demethylase